MNSKPKVPDCSACAGACCRYVATQIDTPRTKRDYDHIRWYLLHKKVNVFIDHENGWYLEFQSDCEELDHANRCRIYERRPRICRNHGTEDTACEFVSHDSPYKQYFSSADELEAYLDTRGVNWRWKRD